MAAACFFVQVACGKERVFQQISTDETIGQLLTRSFGLELDTIVSISAKATAGSLQCTTITDTSMPAIIVARDFGCKYIDVFVKIVENEDPPPDKPAPTSALQILMNINRISNNLPPEREVKTQRDAMFNTILATMKCMDIGFNVSQLATVGRDTVKDITSVLWFIDPYREKFIERSINLPFTDITGFNDNRLRKQKKPILLAENLKEQIDCLCLRLEHPWFSAKKVQPFTILLAQLLDALKQYYEFMLEQQKRTTDQRCSLEPIRSLKDNWKLRFVPANKLAHVAQQYSSLMVELKTVDNHCPIALLKYEPDDRYDRRRWLENLSFPFRVAIYSHVHGNSLRNINFLWRTDMENDDLKTVEVIAELKCKLPTYSTRAMRREYFDRYSKISSDKPAILRSMYRYLRQDATAAENDTQASVDYRLEQCLLVADDEELIYDLRINNGKVADEKFVPFWDELQKLLDETAAVHERRQGDHLYLPFAISVTSLRSEIQKRLPPDTPLPSISWIRFNFWPCNPYTRSAMAYTGRFKVKFAIQQRLVRGQHPDAEYTSYQFRLLKEMAVRYREFSTMICIDDKAVVPIGEPNTPISTGVRPHNKSLVLGNTALVASDHDFHVAGAIPSVLFHVDIPDDVHSSFHRGTIHVTVKDKVFQPSSPMRHSRENVALLRNVQSDDELTLTSPILFVYSDGGPDHRTNYKSVQCAAVSMFIALDLDVYIAARTGPMQSYANPAERCMSALNLALQNVALCKDTAGQTMDRRIKSLSSLTALRRGADRDPGIKKAFVESISPVMTLLKQRFNKLVWQESLVQVHEPATEEEIVNIQHILSVIDPSVVFPISSIDKHPQLKIFFDEHCRSRTYTFQIMKCQRPECVYCAINPPRLPVDVFEGMSFLPDPVLGADNSKYLPFAEVYGTDTSEKARPSLLSKPQPTEADRRHKKVFVGDRVRQRVMCTECGKARVVYSTKKLSLIQELALKRVQEEVLYTCGSILFESGPYVDTVVVREGISCMSMIETPYYAAKMTAFPAICIHCGSDDLYIGSIVQEHKRQFSIVRPICSACLAVGKEIVCRNAVQVGKKLKKK